MEKNMLPLGLLSAGEKAEVIEVSSHIGRCLSARKENGQADARIEDIGIRSGKMIEMLNNGGRGPILLKVDESRIAIGRGMAMKIMVRRKE
ncbi:MAG: FeoA family protein [Thermodesulfovibrionales bacterium]|jgi:ferrous iron transport protein A